MTAHLLFAAGVVVNAISLLGVAVDATASRRPGAGWVVLALWLLSLALMGAA